MKHPDAIEVIEFPSGRIMEYTQKILVVFAIAFLGSLSLSSAAYIKKDLDFAKNLNFEVPRTLREKRQSEHFDLSLTENNAAELEDLSELDRVHDRRAIAEEIQEASLKYEKLEEGEKQNAHKEHSDTEENTQDEVVPYKNVHNVMHALMYADDEDLAEKLQELKENSTDSDGNSSKLLKRHLQIENPLIASGILGTDILEDISLERLDTHSCAVEAFDYGHLHDSGLMTHELFCELRKFPHYMLIAFRNLKSELTLGPLITEEFEDDVLGSFHRHIPQLFETVIKEPHHLLLLPEIIRDVLPISHILQAIHRIGTKFFHIVNFVHNIFKTHLLNIVEFFLLHHDLGLHLLRTLHHLGESHLLKGFGLLHSLEDIIAKPVLHPVAAYDDEIYIPEYHNSLGEVIATVQGLHDGYYASGIHDLFRSSMRTLFSESTRSTITSFMSTIPYLNNIVPYLDTIYTNNLFPVDVSPVVNPLLESFVPAVSPIVEGFGPLISPLVGLGSVVSPIAPVGPFETETVSTAVSSAASAASTVDVAGPLVAPVIESPVINPLVGYGYGSIVNPVESFYPGYPAVTETVTSSASSAASASSTVDASSPVISPVVGGPLISPIASLGHVMSPVASVYPAATETVTSSASSAASASSTVDASSPVVSPVVGGPVISPIAGLGSVVSPVASVYPAATETASSSASSSASTTTTVVESQPIVAAEPVVSYVAPAVVPTISAVPYPISSPAVSVSETTAVSQSSSTSVSVAEPAPVVEAIPEVVNCAPAPVVVPNAVESTVTTTASASASASSASDVAAVPFSSGPHGFLSNFRSAFAPAAATSASASSSATVSTTDHLVEPIPFAGYGLNYPGFPLAHPGFPSALSFSPALASAVAAAGVSTASSTTSVISRRDFNFVLPREKVVGVLGSDCMLPGDIVSVTLRNKATLYGSVLDANSPINFSFLRPKLYGSLLRKGARVWNVLHSDFTDPECVEIFNDPVLLNVY